MQPGILLGVPQKVSIQIDVVVHQMPDLCTRGRFSRVLLRPPIRFAAGYMLLYDDQGVSLVYGTLADLPFLVPLTRGLVRVS